MSVGQQVGKAKGYCTLTFRIRIVYQSNSPVIHAKSYNPFDMRLHSSVGNVGRDN
jgi:hypothetical protein